jgi:hypothetical protein
MRLEVTRDGTVRGTSSRVIGAPVNSLFFPVFEIGIPDVDSAE